MLRGIAQVVGELQPQLIFAPDPDVTSECHVDHLRVGESAKRIGFFAPFREIMARCGAEAAPVEAVAFYMTAKADRFVKTPGLLKKQLSAIFECHKSQFAPGCAEAAPQRIAFGHGNLVRGNVTARTVDRLFFGIADMRESDA